MKTNGTKIRSRLFSLASALAGMVFVVNAPLHAQIEVSPVWDVNGQIVLTGNNVCDPSPCTETVDFSFDYTYALDQNGVYVGEITGSPTISSYGPLAFSQIFSPPGELGNYMPIIDSTGSGYDELDLITCPPVLCGVNTAPSFQTAQLYACETATCVTDFALPSGIPQAPPVQSTVVEVPEGGTTVEYCASCFAFIGCALLWKRRKSRLNYG